MRRVVEQPLALGEVLVDEPELALLEIAQPPWTIFDDFDEVPEAKSPSRPGRS